MFQGTVSDLFLLTFVREGTGESTDSKLNLQRNLSTISTGVPATGIAPWECTEKSWQVAIEDAVVFLER